jgi:hypothetical protein
VLDGRAAPGERTLCVEAKQASQPSGNDEDCKKQKWSPSLPIALTTSAYDACKSFETLPPLSVSRLEVFMDAEAVTDQEHPDHQLGVIEGRPMLL